MKDILFEMTEMSSCRWAVGDVSNALCHKGEKAFLFSTEVDGLE